MQGKKVPGVGGIVYDIRLGMFYRVNYTEGKVREWTEVYQELALRDDLWKHPDLWQEKAKAEVVVSAVHLCKLIDPDNVIAPGTTWTAEKMSKMVAEHQANAAGQS